MNLPQLLSDALVAEIKIALPSHTVEAREPAETELKAERDIKQVFVTTEGFEPGEQYANLGESTPLMLPIMVACIMPRPSTVPFALKTLVRRQKLIQAVQRVIRDFPKTHTNVVGLNWIQEQPSIIESYFVSIQGVELRYDLSISEEL